MIFFNSSMPRSGSTLLQNILAQNPSIHATPTDGFLELIYAARVNFTNCAEFKAQDESQMISAWRGFCNQGMKGYVSGLSDKPNTCIKSRGIGENFDWFESFMGEPPKIVVMVRDVKDVLASMEKIHRKNPERTQSITDPSNMSGLTTESRVQQWLSGPPVGLSIQRLHQMALQGTSNKCLFVKFEDLTAKPSLEMNRVYNYLGMEHFNHDFGNVEQATQEDDAVFGVGSLHDVRPKVEELKPDHVDVLGGGLCKWIDETCSVYQNSFGYI